MVKIYNGKPYEQMDDLGVPLFLANTHMLGTSPNLGEPSMNSWRSLTYAPPPEIAGVPYDQGLLIIGFA